MVIEKAKKYAKIHDTSVSQIVEEYLEKVVAKEQAELANFGPMTQSLFGVASGIPSNKSYKDIIASARAEKYQGIPK